MKYSMHLSVVGLLAIGLTGCSYQAPKDIGSSFYSPPVGSTLTLNQSIEIPANNTQVRIQDGKIIKSYWSLDAYYPNCNFELRDIAPVERTVKPDTFNISRVIRDTENVMLNRPTVVAGSGDGGPPTVDYMTIMELYSANQPDVVRISCQHWNEANDGEHLNIKQIRKTLGDIFTLSLSDN